MRRFADVVSATPEAMELYRMAGQVDYQLRVAAAKMVAFDGFYRKLVTVAPLKNVTSRFAVETIKSTPAYPLIPAPPNTARTA